MLLRFGIENYRSIGKYQEFSMVSDSAIKDRVDTLIQSNAPSVREPLVSVAVIYGANASGKSNLLKGLEYLKRQLLYSHNFLFGALTNNRQPFKLDRELLDQPTKCDVDFVWNNVRYHYGFEATDKEFVAEWLFDFPSGRKRVLFERTGPLPSDVTFGSSIKASAHELARFMRPDSLLASVAIQNNFGDVFPVAVWAFTVFVDVSNNHLSLNEKFARHSTLLQSNKIDHRIVRLLEAIDTGISGFELVDEMPEPYGYEPPKGQLLFDLRKSAKKLYALHKSKDGEDIHFEISDESSGTQRMLFMLHLIFSSLDGGNVLVIDEMNASLHTLVGQKVLELFMNKTTNPKGAQLLVTTHDTNIMNHEGLRRDQIWFTEKDRFGATHVFPLTDFKARKGQNVEKGYLEGRFGAIPYACDISRFVNKVND